MTFIDWSHAEGMLALLIEYVEDEKDESEEDILRQQFLEKLLVDLAALEVGFATMSEKEAIEQLRTIHSSIDKEFEGDPVTVHVKDCIDELERVESQGATSTLNSDRSKQK